MRETSALQILHARAEEFEMQLVEIVLTDQVVDSKTFSTRRVGY